MLDPNTYTARENVDRIQLGDKTIYLVGTAHISQSSADLVAEVIKEIKPETVAVELCASRLASLKDPHRWRDTDLVSVIRSGRAYVLLAQLILAGFQKKLGEQLNIKPGAEMMAAIKTAEELNIPTVTADREVRITLKRVWSSLGWWGMLKVSWAMLRGLLSDEKINAAEIERLKSADALEEMMRDFTKALPDVRTALIDERDQYLAEKIQSAPGQNIVAIVGAGHVPGIKTWLGRSIDLGPLEIVPAPKWTSKALAWAIPAVFVVLLIAGFFNSGFSASAKMIEAWIWITGAFAAFGAALALPHPLTAISAFVAAPITTLHPFIGSGWVAGLVEAWVRKPRVSDLETIADDISTFRGIWSNRVSRILLVMALTNLFGALGMFIGLGEVARHV